MKIAVLSLGVLLSATVAGCAPREVSFRADIQPILKQHCLECHAEGGQGSQASGLLMTDYDSLMKGTRFGSVIQPGDGLSSTLIMLVEGRADQSIVMPHGRKPLPKEQVATLRTWVEQGARNN